MGAMRLTPAARAVATGRAAGRRRRARSSPAAPAPARRRRRSTGHLRQLIRNPSAAVDPVYLIVMAPRMLLSMPLHAITEVYGEAGLRDRFALRTGVFPADERKQLDRGPRPRRPVCTPPTAGSASRT